jgi:hypothetical protein
MPRNEKGHAALMARNLDFDLWLTPRFEPARGVYEGVTNAWVSQQTVGHLSVLI